MALPPKGVGKGGNAGSDPSWSELLAADDAVVQLAKIAVSHIVQLLQVDIGPVTQTRGMTSHASAFADALVYLNRPKTLPLLTKTTEEPPSLAEQSQPLAPVGTAGTAASVGTAGAAASAASVGTAGTAASVGARPAQEQRQRQRSLRRLRGPRRLRTQQ